MSDHYYTKLPESEMITETKEVFLRQQHLTFTTSSGALSKKAIDFGTKELIETCEPPAPYGDFLDLGCGYGPVGITLATAYPERNTTMVDINERALMLARNNALNNGVEHAESFNSQGLGTLEIRSFPATV